MPNIDNVDLTTTMVTPGFGGADRVNNVRPQTYVKDIFSRISSQNGKYEAVLNAVQRELGVNLRNIGAGDQQKLQAAYNQLRIYEQEQRNTRTLNNRYAANQSFTQPFAFSFQNLGGSFLGPARFYNQVGGTSKLVAATKERFLLPVPPADFNVTVPNNPQTISTIDGQTYSHAGNIELDEISFESFFPNVVGGRSDWPNFIPQYYRGANDNYVYGWHTPQRWVHEFVTAMRANQPLLFCVYSVNPDSPSSDIFAEEGMVISPMAVTVSSFDWNMGVSVGGTSRDIQYSITLKRWRRQQIRINNYRVTNGSENNDPALDVPPVEPLDEGPQYRKYTVRAGDTLTIIAQKLLKDGRRWREIYNLNKSIIGSNPNLIRPGQVLRIPKKG